MSDVPRIPLEEARAWAKIAEGRTQDPDAYPEGIARMFSYASAYALIAIAESLAVLATPAKQEQDETADWERAISEHDAARPVTRCRWCHDLIELDPVYLPEERRWRHIYDGRVGRGPGRYGCEPDMQSMTAAPEDPR